MKNKQLCVFLGPPGSGKGQQSILLQEKGWCNISSGQLLRAVRDSGTAEGDTIQEYLHKGQLVPDALMISMVLSHIDKLEEEKILLDGFPRTVVQATAMTAAGCVPTHIAVYVITDEVVVDRISGRWIEPKSGRVYHTRYAPPQMEGRDDITGEPLVRRDDDMPDVIRGRLAIYNAQVKDIIEYYRVLAHKHAINICYINAEDSIDGVQAALLSFLA